LLQKPDTFVDDSQIFVERSLQYFRNVQFGSLADNCDYGRLSIQQCTKILIFRGLSSNSAGATKSNDLCLLQFKAFYALKVIEILRIGSRPASFYIRNAEPVYQFGQLQFIHQ